MWCITNKKFTKEPPNRDTITKNMLETKSSIQDDEDQMYR